MGITNHPQRAEHDSVQPVPETLPLRPTAALAALAPARVPAEQYDLSFACAGAVLPSLLAFNPCPLHLHRVTCWQLRCLAKIADQALVLAARTGIPGLCQRRYL